MRIKCPTTNNDPLIGIIDPVCAGAVCIRGGGLGRRESAVSPLACPLSATRVFQVIFFSAAVVETV